MKKDKNNEYTLLYKDNKIHRVYTMRHLGDVEIREYDDVNRWHPHTFSLLDARINWERAVKTGNWKRIQ